jgi:DNA-binding response OmpR family regulator
MTVRILVVDDDEPTRRILSRLLTGEGYDVDACEDGEHALAQLRVTHYDVLVTDWVMPGMSGLDLLSAARAQCDTLRCMVISGQPQVAGMPKDVAWLAKPIDVDQLLAQLSA